MIRSLEPALYPLSPGRNSMRDVRLLGGAFFLLLIIGCGTDRSLLMETKLDVPLRQRLTDLQERELTEDIDISGKCTTTIDGSMREDLMNAGADVHRMTNEAFTATIPSDRVLDVAALEFVLQLQLSRSMEPAFD